LLSEVRTMPLRKFEKKPWMVLYKKGVKD
jgi:hypothetical protein